MMSPRTFLLGGLFGFIVLRAARAAAPKAVVEIGPARIIKSGAGRWELDIGTARVREPAREPAHRTPRGGGGGVAAPMQVAFFARVSGFEKLGVSASDVADAVRDNAFVLPGIGKPRVTVQDVSGGFKVTVRYPDSRSGIGSSAARRAIESIDPRLSGRIQNVAVARTVHA